MKELISIYNFFFYRQLYDASVYWSSNSFTKHEITSETPLNFDTNMYPNHIMSAEQKKQYHMNQDKGVSNHNMLTVNNNCLQNENYNTNKINLGTKTYTDLSSSSCWTNISNNSLRRDIKNNNNFNYNGNKKGRLNDDTVISFANI